MFTKSFTIFRLFGFEVKMDLSWLLLGLLITWSLAVGVFPAMYEDLRPAVYWWMGALGALGLLLSIVFHEMAHSLVARRFGLSIKGITLFLFGGVAEMPEEPSSPRSEFWMAIAGPASSLVLALLFYGVSWLGSQGGWPVPWTGVLEYLAYLNIILAVFNLVPAFPLDGGRILRAALWAYKRNLAWATRLSAAFGQGFGFLLIVAGAISVLRGSFIGGMWWFLIGLFLRNASQRSYQQVLVRKALEGEKVSRFMNRQPITVEPGLSVKDLVESYMYRYHHKMFPVVQSGRLLGCVGSREVQTLARERWDVARVRDLQRDCSDQNTIDPDSDATAALTRMSRHGLSRLLVAQGDRLVGIVSLMDLLRFLSIKMDLDPDLQPGSPNARAHLPGAGWDVSSEEERDREDERGRGGAA